MGLAVTGPLCIANIMTSQQNGSRDSRILEKGLFSDFYRTILVVAVIFCYVLFSVLEVFYNLKNEESFLRLYEFFQSGPRGVHMFPMTPPRGIIH